MLRLCTSRVNPFSEERTLVTVQEALFYDVRPCKSTCNCCMIVVGATAIVGNLNKVISKVRVSVLCMYSSSSSSSIESCLHESEITMNWCEMLSRAQKAMYCINPSGSVSTHHITQKRMVAFLNLVPLKVSSSCSLRSVFLPLLPLAVLIRV